MDLIKPNTKIDFVGKMNKAVVFSVILTILAIGSLVYHKGPNWGVEFRGGTEIHMRFASTLSTADLTKVLNESGYHPEAVQRLGFEGDREYLLRFSPDVVKFDQIQAFRVELEKLIKEKPELTGATILRIDYIGPNVGKELVGKAIISVLLGCVGIMIYVMLRFEFVYALGAVIALAHDTIMTMGAISITNKEFTLTIIAALLTIIGFSVHDTIIIFDRIRENLKKSGGAKGFTQVVNESVNQTLSRTILTSFTVFLVLLSLYLLGGTVIHDFAFTMIFGVLFGTYSSIFVASAIVIYWKKWTGTLT